MFAEGLPVTSPSPLPNAQNLWLRSCETCWPRASALGPQAESWFILGSVCAGTDRSVCSESHQSLNPLLGQGTHVECSSRGLRYHGRPAPSLLLFFRGPGQQAQSQWELHLGILRLGNEKSYKTTLFCSPPRRHTRLRSTKAGRPGGTDSAGPTTQTTPPPPQRGPQPTVAKGAGLRSPRAPKAPDTPWAPKAPEGPLCPLTILKPNPDPNAHPNLKQSPNPTLIPNPSPNPNPSSTPRLGLELVLGSKMESNNVAKSIWSACLNQVAAKVGVRFRAMVWLEGGQGEVRGACD